MDILDFGFMSSGSRVSCVLFGSGSRVFGPLVRLETRGNGVSVYVGRLASLHFRRCFWCLGFWVSGFRALGLY